MEGGEEPGKGGRKKLETQEEKQGEERPGGRGIQKTPAGRSRGSCLWGGGWLGVAEISPGWGGLQKPPYGLHGGRGKPTALRNIQALFRVVSFHVRQKAFSC